MPRIYDVCRVRCPRCEGRSIRYETDEWDGIRYAICNNCGHSDLPDGFSTVDGYIKDYCPTCAQTTKQRIVYFDDWDGEARFQCTQCNTKAEYRLVAQNEFERVQ